MREVLSGFDEYQKLAVRTMKHGTFLEEVVHCSMGMSGEAGESKELGHSDRDKKIGEIGDCMWYAASLANTLSLSFGPLVNAAKALNLSNQDSFAHWGGEDRALIWSCRLIDIVKKWMFYDKAPELEVLAKHLTHYVAALLDVCAKVSVDPLLVATKNIQKLEARYPDKMFNAAHAVNRDYGVESKAAGIELV